jgi:hexosaminidase
MCYDNSGWIFAQKLLKVSIMQTPILLPAPRSLNRDSGTFVLPQAGLIVAPPALLFEAKMIQKGLPLSIVAHTGGKPAALTLFVDETMRNREGYHLKITPESITIRGADAAGVYYGCCTLRQLLDQYERELPCLTIEDYPDFPARGVMLDISRDKVPTMETLTMLVEKLASWKINQFQLYIEHTFAYQDHEEVWANASPMTGQEIMELDALCRLHHIELVPNQNSLGHVERWLKFERYLPMAEMPDGFTARWGAWSPPTTLDPTDPKSLEFISSLYDEFLPHFTSMQFNVGGDEPWELGQGKSKESGKPESRIYLDWLLKLHDLVKAHGKRMQFWGDIIMEHPELVPELPKDLIALEWGYEGIHDFEGHSKLFAESGIPFYVCPGTSSWNSLIGRTDNMIENLRIAAVCGLKNGAIGFLNTDWGDRGHWQPLSVSYPGYAVGAAFSWSYETNKDLDFPAAFDLFVFRDRAKVMGRLAYDLGNVYNIIGLKHINGQLTAYLLQREQDKIDSFIDWVQTWRNDEAPDTSPATIQRYVEAINSLVAQLDQTDMQLEDADIIRAELTQAAELARHGAYYLLLARGSEDREPQELLQEWESLTERQRETWLMRNRPGGLSDSLERFETVRKEYSRLLAMTV